jgi:hypothetical protein
LLIWASLGVGRQEAAEGEGASFGASATDQACVAEVIRQVRASDNWLLLTEGAFLGSCLRAATATQGFCTGVPLPSDQDAGLSWRLKSCKSADLELDDANCSAIYWPIQNHCIEQKALQSRGE